MRKREHKLESKFQSDLIKELEERFPGCLILKNDEQYCQGIQDLLILYKDRWALLESKAWTNSGKRPNQDHYVEWASEMSFSAFINPKNKEEVLDALQESFEFDRCSRVPFGK